MSLLDVENLTVTFPTADGEVQAVRDVSFRLESGRTLGVVGESGSGKSVTMQSVIGLTQGAHVSGRVLFDGRDLLRLDSEDLRRIRGDQISIIFQDPLSSLHPHYRIGWQVAEAIRAHERLPARQARRRVVDLLGLVGVPQPERRIDDYPHQFSGGMRQRVMIAIAIARNPRLLIADEPTTALDVTVQAQILALLQRIQHERGLAIVMISHDLGVIAEMANEAMVMYAGRVVERASRQSLYNAAHHPYTRGLLLSLPARGGIRRRLKPIPGQPPSLIHVPPGCPFHPRCPFVMDRCLDQVPPLHPVVGDGTHESACWLPDELCGLGPMDGRRRAAADQARSRRARQLGEPAAASDAAQKVQ